MGDTAEVTMTREEEIVRLAEIETKPYLSDKGKAWFRKYMERKWWQEDNGIIDMTLWKVERMIARADKT